MGCLVAAVATGVGVQLGVIGLVAVASLLPFAVIPISFGVQLTFVDALVGAVLSGWLVHVVARDSELHLSSAARALLLYIAVAVAALLAGSVYEPLSGPVVRGLLKSVAAMLLMLAVASILRSRDQIRGVIGGLILCGGLAAVIGLVLHAQPPTTIMQVLSSLSAVGYPSGREVLRYLPAPNNTYSETLRATGTSVDPNVFGGLLMLAAVLMVAQWYASRPVLPRILLVPLTGVTVAAMVATYSRSSWVGLSVAIVFLATFRYRKLWLLAILVALGLLYLPIGQEMLERLASGFAGRDRAAALRLDEYRQAFQLIAAYPLLGVGFGGAPELGTFVGVSSMYLLVGEHTGLLGLGLYLAVLATLFGASVRAVKETSSLEDRSLFITLQAPLVAAMTAGLFDHYFMNPRFPHMVALFWLYAGLLAATTRLAARGLLPSGRHAEQ